MKSPLIFDLPSHRYVYVLNYFIINTSCFLSWALYYRGLHGHDHVLWIKVKVKLTLCLTKHHIMQMSPT